MCSNPMKAMLLEVPGQPLQSRVLPVPQPNANQILVRIHACGVCRTDLHVADGELIESKLPLVLGHEIVGTVESLGANVQGFRLGQRVGIPWLGHTCGTCSYCLSGRENLCDSARFTGYHQDGGYAQYTVADARYCFVLPDNYSDAEAAPLLCAGLIGYRALTAAGEAKRLGIYGFGAAAHIITQVTCWQGRNVYAFTKPGDVAGQAYACKLGAVWSGDSTCMPPEKLDAAILFAPVGALVPAALRAVVKGGTVVCAGIHMSDIPQFPYSILWGERQVRSVANLTRRDAEEFLTLAPQIPIKTEVRTFHLEQANKAMQSVRDGTLKGAAVLMIGNSRV